MSRSKPLTADEWAHEHATDMRIPAARASYARYLQTFEGSRPLPAPQAGQGVRDEETPADREAEWLERRLYENG